MLPRSCVYLLIAATVAWTAESGAKPRNRLVRVVTVSQTGLDLTHKEVLDQTMQRLEQAASFRPDIAALPEVFLPDVTATIPGPVTERLAGWARSNASYLIAGLRTAESGKTYNSAVVFDRDGRVMGRYHKMYPTENELKQGLHPGETDPPVFDTDFGKIGVQICFDVNWWHNWTRLKEKGAQMVFFPAAYPAARQLSAIALMNQFFVISSTRSRLSRIYDITGEELSVSGHLQSWAGFTVPIGRRLFEIDFHAARAREIQKKYGQKVEIKWYHEDDWFTLASLDPDLTVEDLIAEFGLTPLNEYRVRANREVERHRAPAK